MSLPSSILRTITSSTPVARRLPLFLPFSSRASSSSSPSSPSDPTSSSSPATQESEPSSNTFGYRTPAERAEPERRHAFSQPLPRQPKRKLIPVEDLSKTRIYVTNLPYDLPEDQLGALFENLTEVSPLSATHSPRKRTKDKTRVRNVGYGFVEWENCRDGWDAVSKAVEWSEKVEVEGKTLKIERAAHKPPSSSPTEHDEPQPSTAPPTSWNQPPHMSSDPTARPSDGWHGADVTDFGSTEQRRMRAVPRAQGSGRLGGVGWE